MFSSSSSSKRLLRRGLSAVVAAACVACVFAAGARAQKVDKAKLDAATRRSGKAIKVLADLSALPPGETIPRELLERARAVAVFPDVDRVNILFMKAMKGYGLISRRVPGGWSTPAFYGFAVTDRGWTKVKPANAGIIMLVMDDGTLKKFERDHVELEAAAGPVGELTAEKEKEIGAAGIIIYALSDGKLHGIEVEDDATTQSGINSDNNINKAVYGLKAREVIWGKTPEDLTVPPYLVEFQNALAALSKK
jgi:lipid-binding SYLF domain-containing protein